MSDGLDLGSLSPLDGRYREQVRPLAERLSELALMRWRLHVEVEWLITMGDEPAIADVRALDDGERAMLRAWVADFDAADGARIREIERTTGHDVKAVEYFLKQRLVGTSLEALGEFVHFCCTSEDINNLAYGTMVKRAMEEVWLPAAGALADRVAALAIEHRGTAMVARTHGQRATPTTLGKELAVFVGRWRRQLGRLREAEYLGKFNGAVGTYSAHVAAYPSAPWLDISRRFVERLGLCWNPLTTQIEPHDSLAEVFHGIVRFNTILADFAADIWAYIALDFFQQRVVEGQVGSSTMPHKVNPIHFENAEANVGVSSALLEHLARKLGVSRLQRDLSDSSALRNIGTAIGHSLLAIHSTMRGLRTLAVNHEALRADLDESWEVLGEAVQTVMRKDGLESPYERIKELTRGRQVDAAALRAYVLGLGLPAADEERLAALTPADYVGLADDLVGFIEEG